MGGVLRLEAHLMGGATVEHTLTGGVTVKYTHTLHQTCLTTCSGPGPEHIMSEAATYAYATAMRAINPQLYRQSVLLTSFIKVGQWALEKKMGSPVQEMKPIASYPCWAYSPKSECWSD